MEAVPSCFSVFLPSSSQKFRQDDWKFSSCLGLNRKNVSRNAGRERQAPRPLGWSHHTISGQPASSTYFSTLKEKKILVCLSHYSSVVLYDVWPNSIPAATEAIHSSQQWWLGPWWWQRWGRAAAMRCISNAESTNLLSVQTREWVRERGKFRPTPRFLVQLLNQKLWGHS